MIDIRGVSKRFGATTALHDVTLQVGSGDVFCLLGANGAGKTTLLNVCLGFLRPDAGTVSIDGHDVSANPREARTQIGYVPEQVQLYDTLTAVEHLEFFSELRGDRLPRQQAVEALVLAGLDGPQAALRVGTYSKGMRQKVALALALASGASTLLLDEPLSGLDPKSAIDLSARLRRLGGEGRALLLTTHDLFRALETATCVGIMRAGAVVHVASTAGLTYDRLERTYLDIMSA